MGQRRFKIVIYLIRRRFYSAGGAPAIPNGAIVQRDGSYILDRSGAYVVNVAQS